MSMLHLAYEDPTFLHPRDPESYDMTMAFAMKPSPFMSEQYMLDHLLHPLAPLPSSQSMPYDIHAGFVPSHYQMQSMPYEVQQANEMMHHPTPIRPIVSASGWPQQTQQQCPDQPPSFPPSSISQPSIFVQESNSRVSNVAPQVADSSVPPPPPWTMSGSLDPSTGVYQIAPEHPRIRTAQACEKCRGRKAKCSGDHPACERCRIRGLKCEYAPERKMRGPNKLKRKPALDLKSSRRTSIASASSMSSTSSASEDLSSSSSQSNSPVSSVFPESRYSMASTLQTSSNASASPSPSPLSGSPSFEKTQLPDTHKRRPSHIDLSGTKLYDHMPPPSAFPAPPPLGMALDGSPTGSGAWRRASLPSYLLESYTNQFVHRSPSIGSVYTPPRGLDVVDATTARPHSNPLYPHEAFNLYPPSTEGSAGGSSSGASMPLTPLTHASDMMYSLDFNPAPLDFSVLSNDLSDAVDVDAWVAVPSETDMDLDVTPRVTSDGHEKSLAQVESELFHD